MQPDIITRTPPSLHSHVGQKSLLIRPSSWTALPVGPHRQHGSANLQTYHASVWSAIAVGALAVAQVAGRARRKRDYLVRCKRLLQWNRRAANSNDDDSIAPHTGVILLNIGTPASTSVDDVRDYLARFLWDDRVVDIQDPNAKRVVIENILRTRPAKSAETYKSIWDPLRGSPLLYHTEDLVKNLQQTLGPGYDVRIGFQYSEPSVETSLSLLATSSVDEIVLVPMFPHFAQATVGALLANIIKVGMDMNCLNRLKVIPPFYKHPGYVSVMADLIESHAGEQGCDVDHIVFSFHGTPQSQTELSTTTDESGTACGTPNCCSRRVEENKNCYRAQCLETAKLLAGAVGLTRSKWSLAFSSRKNVRGDIEWTKPYTDEWLPDLAAKGITRVAVCAPSFTADNVETLAELGQERRESFLRAGGQQFRLIPCINSSEMWARTLADMIRDPPSAGTGFWAM